jgi:calcineurin-like phosphoesterase family protein
VASVRNVFFTSDTHFNHNLVAALRGFGTITIDDKGNRVAIADREAYNKEIVARWNSVVTPNDIVWHLGDVGFGSWEQIYHWVSQLNGEIHLITGNHDKPWPGNLNGCDHMENWMTGFKSIQQFAYRKIQLKKNEKSLTVFLSHFPYDGDHTVDERATQYRLRNEGQWLLHGHTHSSGVFSTGKQIHVGLDAWNLKPVPLDTIAEILRNRTS